MLKYLFYIALIFLFACATANRRPASDADPESAIFQNQAFQSQALEVRTAAERIFHYRISAERAYRSQDNAALATDGHVRRDTHGKTLACPKAYFEVNSQVPQIFQAGIFAQPGVRYPAWIRFANGVGQLRHDLSADARALSIKIMGVKGPKMLASFPDEEVYTQDFLVNNAPTFFVGNVEETEEFFKADADGDISKYFVSSINPLAPTYKRRVAFNALYITKVESNMLKASYWSGSPYQLGEQIVRYVVSPCRDKNFKGYSGLPVLNDSEKEYVDKMNGYTQRFSPLVNGNPDFDQLSGARYAEFYASFPFALRWASEYAASFNPKTINYLSDNLVSDLSSNHEGCFEFGVQAYESEESTPLKQPVAVWRSPTQWIGRIVIPAQTGVAEPSRVEFCENLSFNGWHALTEDAPIGPLNAIRGMVYKGMSSYRHRMNGTSSGEPLSDFSMKLVRPEEARTFYEGR